MDGTLVHHKLKKVILLAGCILCIVIGRLSYLQLILYHRYVQKGQQNFIRYQTTASLRGNICDRHGNLLATNRPVFVVGWEGTGKRKLTPIQQEIITSVAHILKKDAHDLQKIIRPAEMYYKKIILADDISFDQLSLIKERFGNHENIAIHTEFIRFWPHGCMASHILGYLGRLSFKPAGRTGMEKLFETQLQGTDGQLLTTIDSCGKILSKIEIMQPHIGTDIYTTLDLSLQKIAEQTLDQDQRGALIIMDPQTGDILAMVSRPAFDPASFLKPLSATSWQEMQKNNPFLNRACKASYPPGSLFKLVTITAGLEKNIIDQESTVECTGHFQFGNRNYSCHKKMGHATINAKNALAHSCNVFLYDLATHLDIDTLADYAHCFGLGTKTNFLLPEETGLIPTRNWKMNSFGERWWTGETLSAVIGQSYILVTPLQIACMFSSIFTGWIPQPRLLLNQEYNGKKLAISDQTRAFLQDALELVVTGGTGKRINNIDGMRIWAKTSTAQTSQKEKRHLGKKYQEHGWFVAHFQYRDYKPLTMVLLVEHAGSSRVAIQLAKQLLLRYKKVMEQ